MRVLISILLVVATACGASDAPSPSQCATRSVWTGGNRESPRMRPGGTCIGCHATEDGPTFTIAGTVFPTMSELDNCNGTNVGGALSVVVTGSDGNVVTIPVNDVGNFYTKERVVFPFRAKVVSSTGKQLTMTDPQSSGDCNGCHTTTGAHGAPGRIIAPP